MPVEPRGPVVLHPRGTLFLVGVFGVVFAVAWFAVYFLVYLQRGAVTR